MYDALPKPNLNDATLNECLENVLPLQSILWDVLFKNIMNPVALISSGLEKSIPADKNKKIWKGYFKISLDKKQNIPDSEILRFTRLVFRLIQSPFIIDPTPQNHLSKSEKTYPKEIEEIKNIMYVDALISAGNHENEVFTLRITQKQYLKRANFYYTNGIQTIPG